MKKRYVYRNGELVEKAPSLRSFNVLRDIEPFITQDGTRIDSRSELRAYEQKHGVKQVGNDWTGPEKPHFWDKLRNR